MKETKTKERMLELNLWFVVEPEEVSKRVKLIAEL
jgi:hypothetical protein